MKVFTLDVLLCPGALHLISGLTNMQLCQPELAHAPPHPGMDQPRLLQEESANQSEAEEAESCQQLDLAQLKLNLIFCPHHPLIYHSQIYACNLTKCYSFCWRDLELFLLGVQVLIVSFLSVCFSGCCPLMFSTLGVSVDLEMQVKLVVVVEHIY